MFFYFISPQGENVFAKDLQHILQKFFTKKDVSYAVTRLHKNYDVRFHQQEK